MRLLCLYAHRCHAYQSQPGQGPTLTQEDVVLLSEELDLAKMSLAEVQALRLEMRELSRRDQEEGEEGGRMVDWRGRLRDGGMQGIRSEGPKAKKTSGPRSASPAPHPLPMQGQAQERSSVRIS